ncbi:MAG: hypothetical protein AB7I27_16725 [Bacteriovoracaceae bacterium]
MKYVLLLALFLTSLNTRAASGISVENDYQAKQILLSHFEVQRTISSIRELARSNEIEIKSFPDRITSEVLSSWPNSIEQKHKFIFNDIKGSARFCSFSMYVLWNSLNKTIVNARVLMNPICE